MESTEAFTKLVTLFCYTVLLFYYILNLYRTLLSIVYLNFIVHMLMSFYY